MSKFSKRDFLVIAEAEMNHYGLIDKGWTFKISSGLSRHGWCDWGKKLLSVTIQRIEHDSDEQAIGTLRHEIAHALHYQHYIDAGRREEFFAKTLRRRRWVRKVKPHGAEWKKFALMVGVKNPSAASAGTARSKVEWKWNLVIVNDGVIEDANAGFARFPKRLSARYMKGRKRDTLGKLFLVKGAEWTRYVAGKLSANNISFYQDLNYAPVANGVKNLD